MHKHSVGAQETEVTWEKSWWEAWHRYPWRDVIWNGINSELSSSISFCSGALWARAGLTEHSPPGPSSASERLSRAGSRYRVLMVEKLQKKQGEAFLSTLTATQPNPSAGSRGKQLRSTTSPARDPQHPSESTDLPVPLSVRPPWAYLYLSAAPVADPSHTNTQDYKSRQPPRPRRTLAAGAAPRCTLGLVVLPLFPPELRRSGVTRALERGAAEAAVRGAGGKPPNSVPGAVPVLPFSALTWGDRLWTPRPAPTTPLRPPPGAILGVAERVHEGGRVWARGRGELGAVVVWFW